MDLLVQAYPGHTLKGFAAYLACAQATLGIDGLGSRDGNSTEIHRNPPAMAAGVTDRLWDAEDIVARPSKPR